MTNIGYALARAELIHALTAYTGIATADGATPANNTIVDANLIGSNDFITEKSVLIMSGPAAYEDKGAASFVPGTGTITLQSGYSAQITAGTIFRILNISSVEIDVANIDTKIGTNVDAAGTTTLFARLRQIVDTYLADGTIGLAAIEALVDSLETNLGDPSGHTLTSITAKWGDIARSLDLILGARWDGAGDLGTDILAIINALAAFVGVTGIFHEQVDAGINASVVAAEQFIVTLNAANTRYILRDLRLKSVDPTVANTITVKLYTLINDVEVNVDSFIITNANFGTYFSLMDLFGVPYVAGDSIRVSLTGSAVGPYVVTGQYSHGKTNV